MTSSMEALLLEAKNLEMQGLEKHKIALASASSLDQMLNEVYCSRLPKQIDYDNRIDLVRIFNAMAKEIFGNSNGFPIVEVFGSFLMGMFSAESDLDLSINFTNDGAKIPRLKKTRALRKLAKKLHSLQREGGHVSDIQKILTARVPIVKVIDRGTMVECDVSVENRDGIVKSLIIRAISTIDERVQKLSFLVKAWAKAHDINSSKDGTLNSLSLVLLVAFHLQTRDPPILPTFSALFKDGNDPEAVVKMVRNYLNYGARNKESLAELFVTLLIKLASVETLWQKGLCASLCEGFWISKALGSRSCTIHVEDFTDQSQNVARAVGTEGFEKIHSCIHRSLHYLGAFSQGQMLGTKLKELLFGRDSKSTVGDSVAINLNKSTTKLSVPNNRDSKSTVGDSVAINLNKSTTKLSVPNNRDSKSTVGDSVAINLNKSTTKLSVPNNSVQIQKMQLTEDLKGAENERIKQLIVDHGSHETKKRSFTGQDESEGVKRWKGAQLGDKRAGVQIREGVEEHLVENPVKPPPRFQWEGRDPAYDGREWQNFGEYRGHLSTHFAPQPLAPCIVPLSHSLVCSTSHGPVMQPTLSAPNFRSFQGLYNPVPPPPPPPLFSLLNYLGVNISHMQQSTPAPIPPRGPVHDQRAQHQWHAMQRTIRR